MVFLKTLLNLFSKAKNDISYKSAPSPHNPQVLINHFLYGYGENFHCKNEQYYRFYRAMDPDKIGPIKSLDKVRMRMRIRGSYHPEKIYTVTLDKCDCIDFEERQLPCKHIYRLALELGIVSPEWDLSGLSPELRERLSSLSENQQKALFRLIHKQGVRKTTFNAEKRTVPAALIKNGFITEEPQFSIIDKNYTKQELVSILQLSSGCPVTASSSKVDIINYIIQSQPKLAKTLSEKFYRVKYSETMNQNFEFICRYLNEKFQK